MNFFVGIVRERVRHDVSSGSFLIGLRASKPIVPK
jgi:hypothetical protein